MKKLIIIFLFLSIAFSCQDPEGPESCGVENPTENLPWLKETIEGLMNSELGVYFYIVEGRYEGNTVFMVQNCCPFCSSVVSVTNCEGQNLGYLSETNGIDPKKVTFLQTIWKHPQGTCNFPD